MTQSRIESNCKIFEVEQRAQEGSSGTEATGRGSQGGMELVGERTEQAREGERNQIRFEMQANFDRKIILLRDELERREKRYQEHLREATHTPAHTLPSQNTISQRIWSEPPQVVIWVHDLPTTTQSVPSYNPMPRHSQHCQDTLSLNNSPHIHYQYRVR